MPTRSRLRWGATPELRFVALLATFLFAGLPRPAAAQSGSHVVVLGSSTASGSNLTFPDSAWVARFRAAAIAQDPTNRVTNLARGGLCTYDIMPDGYVPPADRPPPNFSRNISEALRRDPDGIVINLPSNDAVAGYSNAEQIANYEALVALAAESGVHVWIATSQPRTDPPGIRDQLRSMAELTRQTFGPDAIEFWSGLAADDGSLLAVYDSGDGIHMNEAGHGVLYQRVSSKNIWGEVAGVDTLPPPPPPGLVTVAAAPNPFRSLTYLNFSLERTARVQLDVFDAHGRHVLRTDAVFDAGSHAFPFEPNGRSSGVYFYRFETDGRSVTGKVVHVE